MRKLTVVMTALLAIVAVPLMAGAYHAGSYINCSDCHTMHASVHNNLVDGSAAPDTPSAATYDSGNAAYLNKWLPSGTQGNPLDSLLKEEVNTLCLTCHDNQTFAPDVVGANGGTAYVRSAGALRTGTTGGGHKLGSIVAPPGYDYARIGATADTYVAGTEGLECASCHAVHGSQGIFRNLGPYQWGSAGPSGFRATLQPTEAVSTTFDATKDVNIGYAGPYVPGDTANFAGYYGAGAIKYAKSNPAGAAGANQVSNRIDAFCGACHGAFHGGADKNRSATTFDANINPGGLGFVRHPTATITMGSSNASTYNNAAKVGWQKAPLYLTGTATTDVQNSTPGCISCHKAHGNSNPFGLLYIGAGALTEEGSASGTFVNLCHQCHGMGASNSDGTKTY